MWINVDLAWGHDNLIFVKLTHSILLRTQLIDEIFKGGRYFRKEKYS